jgi:hypothetical protein
LSIQRPVSLTRRLLTSTTGPSTANNLSSLILSTGGLQAPTIGLLLAVLKTFSSFFGILPAFVGGSNASILFNEVLSFACFKSFGWSLERAETAWKQFVEYVYADTRSASRVSWDGVNFGGSWDTFIATMQVWWQRPRAEKLQEWEELDWELDKGETCEQPTSNEIASDEDSEDGGICIIDSTEEDWAIPRDLEGDVDVMSDDESEDGGIALSNENSEETTNRKNVFSWLNKIGRRDGTEEDADDMLESESDYGSESGNDYGSESGNDYGSESGNDCYELSDMAREQILKQATVRNDSQLPFTSGKSSSSDTTRYSQIVQEPRVASRPHMCSLGAAW